MSKLKKLLAVLVCAAMALALLPCMTAGAVEGTIEPAMPSGDGTAGNPYQIGTAAELYWFAQQVNEGEGDINGVLTADIVVNENLLRPDSQPRNTGASLIPWEPIGHDEHPFIGSFDGQGHTISGIYVNDSVRTDVGLFGCAKESGDKAPSIKNVGVIDSYFLGYSYVGGICGFMRGSPHRDAIIENCFVDVTIETCQDDGGGICGTSDGYVTIKNCYSKGIIRPCNNLVSTSCVGGIIGRAYNSTNTHHCLNLMNVSGNYNVGAICGYVAYGHSKSSVTNNVYLSNTAKDACGYKATNAVLQNNIEMTVEEIAGGAAAYFLNDGWNDGETWRQNIGEDEHPVFGYSHAGVYYGYEHGGVKAIYASTPLHEEADGEGELDHDAMYENGVCTVCGKRQGSEELYTVNSLDVEKVGASLRVKAGVTKNGERSGEDAIVIAMYKDGALVDMLFMEAEFAQGQTARFGGMMNAVDGATVKAFVWDDLTTMAALSNTVEK